MKRNLIAKLSLATTMALGAFVPVTSMMTSIHAEEVAPEQQPVGPIDGMWDKNNIENLEIKLDGQLSYNEKEQTQKIKIKVDDYELKEGKDYEVKGNKATNPGEYEMTVKGINDYHGEKKVKFTVNERPNIRYAQINLANQLVENGQSQRQNITVTFDGKTLKEGTDYVVSNDYATKAGQYSLTVSGINGFGGTIDIGYTVKAAPKQLIDISKCDIKLANQLVANGKDQKQEVVITYYGSKLAEGVDYTVTGNIANKAGQYTMTIKGASNFGGTIAVTYTVQEAKQEKQDFTKAEVKLVNELTDNGKEQVQNIKVTFDGKELKENVDYTVENNKATKAGTYKMTVKGMGKFEGSKEVEFKVAQAKTDDKKEEPKQESNTGLLIGTGIGATGILAGVAAFLKFRKH